MLSQFYYPLKHIHITLAVVSVVLFNGRYLARLIRPNKKLARIWYIIPPIIDTCLLTVGILLATIIYAIPFVTAQWLGIKLCLLVFYIGFGIFAMRSYARSKEAIYAYLMAMVCVSLMVFLAYFKPILWA